MTQIIISTNAFNQLLKTKSFLSPQFPIHFPTWAPLRTTCVFGTFNFPWFNAFEGKFSLFFSHVINDAEGTTYISGRTSRLRPSAKVHVVPMCGDRTPDASNRLNHVDRPIITRVVIMCTCDRHPRRICSSSRLKRNTCRATAIAGH